MGIWGWKAPVSVSHAEKGWHWAEPGLEALQMGPTNSNNKNNHLLFIQAPS